MKEGGEVSKYTCIGKGFGGRGAFYDLLLPSFQFCYLCPLIYQASSGNI